MDFMRPDTIPPSHWPLPWKFVVSNGFVDPYFKMIGEDGFTILHTNPPLKARTSSNVKPDSQCRSREPNPPYFSHTTVLPSLRTAGSPLRVPYSPPSFVSRCSSISNQVSETSP